MASLLHFLGVGVGAVTAAQKTLEEASACLKLDLTKAGKIAAATVYYEVSANLRTAQLKSNVARSHDDVTKLIEVFSQAGPLCPMKHLVLFAAALS